jgi:protein-L-isoaspartate(D-aspartate) O-methyltransferase
VREVYDLREAAGRASTLVPSPCEDKTVTEPHTPTSTPLDPQRMRARAMVDQQIRGRGIKDPAVLAAMELVPRHRFVRQSDQEEAYADRALSIDLGQTISQPYMVALMTELLRVGPGTRVLEIGTGSGYQAAVLAQIGASVISVEREASLGQAAQRLLGELGYERQVRIVIGDGTLGWPAEAPYERILVTAAAPRLPEAYKRQLTEGGIIVIPLGSRDEQDLVVVTRVGDQWSHRYSIGCRFVPLLGKDGWTG